MKSIILFALAAMLTIANTEAHPSPKKRFQCDRAGVCDWTAEDQVGSYCFSQKRYQLLIHHVLVNVIHTQHCQNPDRCAV